MARHNWKDSLENCPSNLVLLINLLDGSSKWCFLGYSYVDRCALVCSKILSQTLYLEFLHNLMFLTIPKIRIFVIIITSKVVSTILSTELRYLVHNICVCWRMEKILAWETEWSISGTWHVKYKSMFIYNVSINNCDNIWVYLDKEILDIIPATAVFHQLVSQPETSR